MDIQVEKLTFTYGNDFVLKEVSFNVSGGEFFGIAGPNGSGKTTLLKLMDGLLKVFSGRIIYNRKNLREFSRREIAKMIAYVSQEHELPFAFTVEEAVLMGRYPHLGILGIEGEKDYKVVESAMKTAGVYSLKNRLVTDLSGGEKQRVIIARALAQEPKVMLLDEPTAHLDLSSGVEIMELLKNLQRSSQLTIVTASHDLNLLTRYADRLMFLFHGEKISEGKPEEILNEALLKVIYGERFHLIYEPLSRLPVIVPGK